MKNRNIYTNPKTTKLRLFPSGKRFLDRPSAMSKSARIREVMQSWQAAGRPVTVDISFFDKEYANGFINYNVPASFFGCKTMYSGVLEKEINLNNSQLFALALEWWKKERKVKNGK